MRITELTKKKQKLEFDVTYEQQVKTSNFSNLLINTTNSNQLSIITKQCGVKQAPSELA